MKINIGGRTVEFHKNRFEPGVVGRLHPRIVHGPHLRDTTTEDGKRFDDACRARAVALAPEGCVFLNWERN